MGIIEVRQLGFCHGRQTVLDGVSFAHDAGVLCLLGANGAGKTTLFRCLLGLLGGYTGQILVDGQDIKGLNAQRMSRLLSYVPQAQAAGFGYTLFEMALMGAAAGKRAPGKADRQAAREALSRVGLENLAERGFTKVSGGERQLALIARAIAQNACALVMDEPTANLDYGNQIRVLAEIRRLAAGGTPVILSTHHPEHARLLGGAVLALKDGRALAHGGPELITDELISHLYGVTPAMLQDLEIRNDGGHGS